MIILHVDKIKPSNEFFVYFKEHIETQYIFLTNIHAGLESLEKNHIDIILVGEELDGNTGVDFIRRLTGTPFNSLPIIFLSNKSNNVADDNIFSLGVVDQIERSELTIENIGKYLKYIKEQSIIVFEMRNLKIAIVDDSRVSHEIINEILNEKDITDITNFLDPRELVKSDQVFDVYFIDMIMPGLNGDKLSKMLRMQNPRSIIIIMSSIDNVKTISNVLSAGADDYIIKPFNKEILLARLKTNFRSFKLLNQLDRIAKTDSLTGAFNHGFIMDKLNEEIYKAKFKSSHLSVLLLDIDLFKEVNDNFGHPCGDGVLIRLSNTFKQNCRKTDYFGRYGGEEFVFIMGHTTLDQALKFTNRVKDIFSEEVISGVDKSVTFSGGLVQYQTGESGEDLIKRADVLLYDAKRGGRNFIKHWSR